VEAYIRTKDFEEAAKILDNWEIDYPDAVTEGYSRLQRVKLLVAQSRPQTAARIAMDHAKALPDGFYAAELIYRAAEADKAANRPADAAAAMELLKSKYPESPYANEKGAKP
jgi:lysyl-tRNA synthetase class I